MLDTNRRQTKPTNQPTNNNKKNLWFRAKKKSLKGNGLKALGFLPGTDCVFPEAISETLVSQVSRAEKW